MLQSIGEGRFIEMAMHQTGSNAFNLDAIPSTLSSEDDIFRGGNEIH